MSADPQSRFPNEIMIQIFKSCDSFATATSFSSTCHKCQSIWTTHAPRICYAILLRTIQCFYEAFQYVKAQSLDPKRFDQSEDMGARVISVTKQFRDNADIASLALHLYETQMIEHLSQASHDPRRLTEAQRDRFLQAWYRIHTLASLPTDPLPYDKLASLDLLEFEEMMDAMWWLMYSCPDERRNDLRINFQVDYFEARLRFRQHPKSSITA